ncbi:MAG: PVC-type heme-binding CxxCH protein [Planctomycetota bacterium]
MLLTNSWLFSIVFIGFTVPESTPEPKVLDDRLILEKIAEQPRIVTPTGIAVDSMGNVLVIESHTHFRPDDYTGPAADRVLRFSPPPGNVDTWNVNVYFEGTRHTMNLGVHPNGTVYVATRREVFALRDADKDGKADQREPIATLKSPGDYPHNGLSGFAFAANGDVYFGLGENLGADYSLEGRDGTTLKGGGEGGSIYRCRPDGTGLTRIATGFWNPFHLCFDSFGRLFAVDNDPDSRPPCRLLHIAPGGDYGYRFRNGRKGLHPFTAWNGELPGTLPMVAGTGEAPSGVLAYESDNLPSEYRGALFGTSWGDHRIEVFHLQPRGASFESIAKPLVQGGENFRPVGIVQAPDGSLFISDWVDKSYTLHGLGRLWRLRSKNSIPRLLPADPTESIGHADERVRREAALAIFDQGPEGIETLVSIATTHENPRARAQALTFLCLRNAVPAGVAEKLLADSSVEVASLAAEWLDQRWIESAARTRNPDSPLLQAALLRRLGTPADEDLLLTAIHDADPFLRQAAREGIQQSLPKARQFELAKSKDPAVRLAILLVQRYQDDEPARGLLPAFLADPDLDIRFAAVEWVSNSHLVAHRGKIEKMLQERTTSRALFAAGLAALSRLDRHPAGLASDVPGEEYVAERLLDKNLSSSGQANVLRMLRPDHPTLTLERLQTMLQSEDKDLVREAVLTLRDSPHAERRQLLRQLAKNESLPTNLRVEAVVGLDPDWDRETRDLLMNLARDDAPDLREEALRSLRGYQLSDRERAELTKSLSDRTRELLQRENVSSDDRSVSTDTIDTWLKRLDGPANSEAGERLFHHPKGPGCYRCHAFEGRGGNVGPDLSTLATGMDRRRLVESILKPSLEVAPRFVPWKIVLRDGSIRDGLLVSEDAEGRQTYINSKGETFVLKREEVQERAPAKLSIMPDNLPSMMTIQEFRDLIAFLTRKNAAVK